MRIDVRPLSETAAAAARQKWNDVAKPLFSMGRFEDMLVRIAAIQGSARIELKPRCVLVFCADHGVVAKGVCQSGSEVTCAVAGSIARGEANVNVLASGVDADVFAVDMGMKAETKEENIFRCRLGAGTRDFSEGPAMSADQAERALSYGIELVGEMVRRGYRLIATGEMGIGNTASASALACALTGADADEMTGRGSGLSDEGLQRKKAVIRQALELHRPDPNNPAGALAALGGFEIAAMAGAFLGGAKYGVPVVIDGMISSVSALAAYCICPEAVSYMLPSHMSRSPAAANVMQKLGLKPVIDAGMALGEGTGAVMLFGLLDAAKHLYDSAHTFESLNMDAYKPL